MKALDTHAHIDVSVEAAALNDLGACIVAATRSIEEFQVALSRTDPMIGWGLGCHPGLPEAHVSFEQDLFASLLADAPVISEVGLDGRSKVDTATQLRTFESILEIVQNNQRILSIHSAGRTKAVLDCLEKHRPSAPILHWWRGGHDETERAVGLGCSFSINPAELAAPRVLNVVPMDRILTETDHPFGDRKEASPQRPGRLQSVERALGARWGFNSEEVRRQVWMNFRALVETSDSADLFPREFQAAFLAIA